MKKGEEFLSGFLGAINSRIEENRKNSEITPENQLRILGMESEGKIKKAPFANDPQGAMQFLAQKLFGGRPDLLNKYQAVPMEEQQAMTDKQRKDYYTVQNYIPGKGYLTHNAATNKFEVVPEDRGVGKQRPNMRAEDAEFFAKAKTLSGVMTDIDKLYKDSYVGPVSGRLGRAVDLYTPFGDSDRSRFRNQVAKAFNTLVYLRSGKQINQEEAVRLAEEFMAVNNTPIAFQSGWGAMKDELNSLVSSRAESLMKTDTAFAGEFKDYGQIKKGSTPESALPKKAQEPNFQSADDIKKLYKSGKLSLEQAKLMIQGLNKGKGK